MAGPFVSGIIPSFKVGQKHVFIVSGQGFAADPNSVHVDLQDMGGGFTWVVDQNKTRLLNANQIEITAKPNRPHDEDPGGGVGDLTVTVTNGDGTTSPPSSTQVYYDDSPDADD